VQESKSELDQATEPTDIVVLLTLSSLSAGASADRQLVLGGGLLASCCCISILHHRVHKG
jgi:hypothetical protein